MEEALRETLRQIWLRKHDGEISKEERDRQTRALIHEILAENPQRLLDLCAGHISGLPDERLLEKAKEETEDFVFMNICTGSFNFATIVRDPPHPDSRKIKKIYRNILGILGLDGIAIKRILRKTAKYESYNTEPAETMLDLLTDEEICASIDWKFELENVEYNLNRVAKKLGLEPIREYPPYEEGQPLGVEALDTIIDDSSHAALAVCDGDTTYVFLTNEEKLQSIKEELDKLAEFWKLDGPFICGGTDGSTSGDQESEMASL